MTHRFRRYTPIQTERVLRDIIARRLLSLQEIAVCAYVWAFSWGFSRQNTDRNAVSGAAIGKWCGMCTRSARQTKADLIHKNVLIVGEGGALEFNEHIETWIESVPIQLGGAELITPRSESLLGANHSAQTELITPSNGVNHSVSIITRHHLDITRHHKERSCAPKVAPIDDVLKEKKTKSRPPIETHFYQGFKKLYSQEHRQLNKGQAIALAKLVSQFGEVAVKRKIDDWWTFPVKFPGRRSIQRFLWAYDDIEHYQSTAELMQQSEAEYGQRQRQNNQHCD